jgi:hypothetical protein
MVVMLYSNMQHLVLSAVVVLAFLCMLMANAAPIAGSSGGRYPVGLTKAGNCGARVLDHSNSSLMLYSLTSLCALPPFTYPSFLNMSRIESQTGELPSSTLMANTKELNLRPRMSSVGGKIQKGLPWLRSTKRASRVS